MMTMILDTQNVIWPRNYHEYYNDQFDFLAAFVEWFPQEVVDHIYDHISILGYEPEAFDNVFSNIMQMFDDFMSMNPGWFRVIKGASKICQLDSDQYRETPQGNLEWVLLHYQ